MMHDAYKNFVHLVGLYSYCRMMHGAYKNFVHLVDLYTYCRVMLCAYVKYKYKVTVIQSNTTYNVLIFIYWSENKY